VEVLGRYSNHSDQGKHVADLVEKAPAGPSTPIRRTTKRVCRRLSAEEIEIVVTGYAQGVPVEDLAAAFGVDQCTIQRCARRHDLPRRSPRLGPKQIEEASLLYAEGQSLAKLSTHLGVATDTVANALRRAGVNLRPRRGWNY
jgi:DNA-directed RNA polymerase specialized sigma24 family protein